MLPVDPADPLTGTLDPAIKAISATAASLLKLWVAARSVSAAVPTIGATRRTITASAISMHTQVCSLVGRHNLRLLFRTRPPNVP